MNLSIISFLAIVSLVTSETFAPWPSPLADSDSILEQFDDSWEDRWKVSHAKRDGEFSYVGKWSVEESKVKLIEGDKGLVVKSPAAHHAISYKFDTPFVNKGKDLVLQYETKFQDNLSCGGAYIKLLSSGPELEKEFNNDTPYQVMFGPDKCGSTNKVHFIVRRKSPETGEYEEKHLQVPPMAKSTTLSTLYTLIIHKNNDFEIRINGEVAKAGNLLDENLFRPSFNAPKEIFDPEDKKPEDWVEEEEIPDPNELEKPADWDEDAPKKIRDPKAKKPKDWDEDTPLYIPDPDSEIPDDWDEEEDGEWIAAEIPNPACQEHGCGPWEPPLIDNPNYKGKWVQKMVPNPAYKGPWYPKKIPNPDFYEDTNASDLEPIGGLGFELWTMDKDLLFDNIYLGHSVEEAEKIGNATTNVKIELEQKAQEDDYRKNDVKDPNELGMNEGETTFKEKLEELWEYLVMLWDFFLFFAESFLSSANGYLVALVEDPVTVLTNRRNEGLLYAGVFGIVFVFLFGISAVILLKLTSGLDDSVDATMTSKEMKEKREKEAEKVEAVAKEKAKEEKVEKMEESEKASGSKKSETKAKKRT